MTKTVGVGQILLPLQWGRGGGSTVVWSRIISLSCFLFSVACGVLCLCVCVCSLEGCSSSMVHMYLIWVSLQFHGLHLNRSTHVYSLTLQNTPSLARGRRQGQAQQAYKAPLNCRQPVLGCLSKIARMLTHLEEWARTAAAPVPPRFKTWVEDCFNSQAV